MKQLNYIHGVDVYYFKGNYYTQRAWFLNGLAEKYKVKLYCNVIKDERIDLEKYQKLKANIDCIDFFKKGKEIKKFIKNIGYYKKRLDSLKKDELFFVHYPDGFIGIVLSFLLRKYQLSIWVKSDPIAQFTIHGNKLSRLIRIILKPFAWIVYEFISRFIFKDNLIFYTSNITVNKKNHLNQIEFISCSNFNKDRSLIKNKMTKKIVFVGGENNQKGLNVLLKAFNFSNRSIELNIVGIDKLQKKQNQKVAQNLNIKLYGKIYKRDRFYHILSRNDILVMPSFGEKQGKVQLEAMSVGVVPICADGGGTYRTIDNYYNGLLFKELDYKELAQKIDILYDNPRLYENLKKNGLEYIQEPSLEKQVNKISKIINNFYYLK